MGDHETNLDAETRAMLTLHLVPGLGPRLIRALLERFGSPENVLQASVADFASIPRLPEKVAVLLAQALDNRNLQDEIDLLERHQTRVVRHGAAEYPEPLAAIPDAPVMLYLKGKLIEADRNAVAVVGTRGCTSYGRRAAEKLADGLARAGFSVVSGLARGIDGIAHEATLTAGGRTIAVLAGGLARIYPPEHADLAERVIANGALISEIPMAVQPLPEMFPRRNRLISGLCRGVVVVEGDEKSGALHTAKHALEQGRDVFAVPGPIDSATSSGCHYLIRNGATLVRHVDDILTALGQVSPAVFQSKIVETPPKPRVALTETQQKIWDRLSKDPVHMDTIIQSTELPVAEVSTALVTMELKGLVRRLPGNRFEHK